MKLQVVFNKIFALTIKFSQTAGYTVAKEILAQVQRQAEETILDLSGYHIKTFEQMGPRTEKSGVCCHKWH